MAQTIVKVQNLTKKYDDKTAVDGISFEIQKGEIFGILGPNGAGKTTTLEMIETIREIDGGTIHVDGLDDAALQRLYGLAALADDDATLRHGHDVDLTEAGPLQRCGEDRADGNDGAAGCRVRRGFLQRDGRRQEGPLV